MRIERLLADELPVGAPLQEHGLDEPAHRRQAMRLELRGAFLQSALERRRRTLEGGKHEAEARCHGHRLQSEPGPVESRVLRLPRHAYERARVVVLPAVARAANAAIYTECEPRGRVTVDQSRAAMPADVAEAADRAIRAAEQQSGAAQEIEADRRPGRRQIGDVADELPTRQEDAFALQRKEFGTDIAGAGEGLHRWRGGRARRQVDQRPPCSPELATGSRGASATGSSCPSQFAPAGSSFCTSRDAVT